MEDQQVQAIKTNNNINERNPFKIATIILSIAVLGLGGLSVFLGTRNSEENGTDFNNQTGKTDEDKAVQIETPSPAPSAPGITDNSVQYLTIPEWGVKFKIPSALTDVSYSFVDFNGESKGSISVSATLKSDNARGFECGNLSNTAGLTRSSYAPIPGGMGGTLEPITQIGGYYYTVTFRGAQLVCADSEGKNYGGQLVYEFTSFDIISMFNAIEKLN